MPSMNRVAVLGFGNMAKALFKGAEQAKACDPRVVKVFDPNLTVAAVAPFQMANSVAEAIQGTNTAWFCVKPDVVSIVAKEMSGLMSIMKKNPLFVSIAAGISEQAVRDSLGQPEAAVIRVMPNLPVLVGKGASGFYANEFVTSKQLQTVTTVLNATGIAIQVEKESDLHAITAVSGSGPAYVLRFMQEFIDAAQGVGLSEKVARKLVMQTVFGAAQLADTSEFSLDELCEQVRSKGGTTGAALRSFDQNKLGQIVQDAVVAARDRSVELGALSKSPGEPPVKKPNRGVVDPRLFSVSKEVVMPEEGSYSLELKG